MARRFDATIGDIGTQGLNFVAAPNQRRGAASVRTAIFASTMLAGIICTSQALAQSAPQAGVEEIVVTAQKRIEKLQDVPVSVSAISGKQLEEQHLSKVDDIVAFVPSLHVTSPDGEGTPIFALRGVSMSDYSLNQDGPVATYFDEVYKGAFALLGVSMFDLERVEVLRGPQGTLYGKNTTGGAVNVISHKPTFSDDGEISVGYGNYNHWQASGDWNTAFSDKIAARAAFTAERADGWMTDVLPGKPKLDSLDAYAGRVSLLVRPTSNAEFILRISGSRQHPENYGVKGEPLTAPGIGGPVYNLFGMPGYTPTGLGKYEVQNGYVGHRLAKTWSASLTGNIQLAHELAIASVSSWDWGKLFIPDDSSGSPTQALIQIGLARAQQIAQDLRLTSNFSGPFNFIFGAYFNREHIFNSTTLGFYNDIDVNGDGVINGADCLAGFPIACRLANSFDQIKTSTAVYTELKYTLTEHLTVRGGLRYTYDEGKLVGYQSQYQDASGNFLGSLISPSDVAAEGADRFKKSNVSGKAGLDYKTSSGQLIYISYSRGYRGNGFNAQAFFSPAEVTVAKPETLADIEGGAKLQLFDRRLILNLSAFHYDYKNMQFINVNNALQQLVNLPKARVFGGEAEATARPTRTLTFRVGLGLLDSKIQKGELLGEDLMGRQLMNAPRTSLSLGVDWTIADTEAGRASVHGESTITSRQYFDPLNSVTQSQGGYGLLNGGAEFRSADRRWGVSLWAKNLLNQYYYTSRIAVAFANENYQHVGTPRTFGATLNYSF